MKIRFQVTGMTCAACSARVEKVSSAVEGVHKAEVNLLKGILVVEADSDAVAERVIEEVRRAGYGAQLYGAETKEESGSVEKEMK